jgi:hypothetical protein
MFFFSGGMSILTDVITSSSSIATLTNSQGATYSESYQHFQWNYASFMLSGRMNIANLGESSTLSISATPTIGLGMAYSILNTGSWYSVGSTIPAFIEYNFGTASRFQAKNDYGFVVGVGYEYNIYPLFAYAVSETDLTPQEFQKKWNQLAFELGLRYWNDKNRVNEINFKLGYGSNGKEFTNFENKTEKEKQAMSFRLSFLRILNY